MTYSNLDLANAFIQTGELGDALAALNRHLDDTPQDEDGRRLRAEVLARLPGDESLLAALADLQALSIQTTHDIILQSVLLERLGAIDQALATVAEGQKRHPDDDRLTERYLVLLRKMGKVDQAREIVDRLVTAESHDWRWTQWAGDLAADAGDDQAAIEHYSAALAAIAARYDIDTDSAAKQLSDKSISDAAAMTIGGIYARLLLARADAYVRLGDLDAGETDYRSAAILIPDEPMIPFNLGLIAARRGDLEGAVEQCRRAYAGASDTLQAHMWDVLDGDDVYAGLRTRLLV